MTAAAAPAVGRAPHPLAAAVRAGRPAFGTFIMGLPGRALPWIARQAGLDFLMYDREHGNLTTDEVRAGVLDCRALGLTPIVRVPVGTRSEICPALDMGAQAIIIPMAESAEQVAAAIDVAMYAPEGTRGAAFGIAHDQYAGQRPATEVMAEANASTMIIPLIETRAGVEAADEICALPGVEIVQVGPVDLTQSLGKPCDFDDPEYLAAMETIAAAARRNGVAPMLLVNSPEGGVKWHEAGYRVFSLAADLWLLQTRLETFNAELRELIAPAGG